MNKTLIITGTICAFLWLFLTLMTLGLPIAWCEFIDGATFHLATDAVYNMANGFYPDISGKSLPTQAFLVVFFIIFAIVFWVTLKVEKREAEKPSLKIIVFFAVLFRLILLPGELIHGNDIYRCLWDGKVFASGVNPYKYKPADLIAFQRNLTADTYDQKRGISITARKFSNPERRDMEKLAALREGNPVFFERISYLQAPTGHPPAAQLVFLLSALIRPNSILVMKLIFLLFDAGVLWLIIAILKYLRRNPALVIVYAWSPLVLKEFANTGHYGPMAVFAMLLAFLLYLKRERIGFVCSLAVSTLNRFFAAIFLPVFARCLNWRQAAAFMGVIMLGYLPFMAWGGVGFDVFKGFMIYNRDWSYNGSVFALIYAGLKEFVPFMTESLLYPKLIAGAVYLIGLAVMLARNHHTDDRSLLHKSFVALAGLFIMSPVGNPWYFCWVIPLLCLFPYRSWILLSGLLALSYLNFQLDFMTQTIFHIPLANWIIYVPFLGYWLFERFYQKRRFV